MNGQIMHQTLNKLAKSEVQSHDFFFSILILENFFTIYTLLI